MSEPLEVTVSRQLKRIAEDLSWGHYGQDDVIAWYAVETDVKAILDAVQGI